MERFPQLALQIPGGVPNPSQKEQIPPLALDRMDLLYFYGIGQGEPYFFLREWLRGAKGRRLIFLEDDLSRVASLLHNKKCAQILKDDQVFISQPRDVDALAEQFPLAHIEAYCLPSRRGRRFQALRLQLLRKTALAHALHLDRLHGNQPFENFVRNLRHLPRSFYANRLQGRFQGVPAIVCGAGPSLDHAIPFLKTVEKKALVIAGGSTLAALSSQGISPHFGMAVDPNLEEYRRLRNSFAFEIPLLYSTRVFPTIFQTCNGPFGYMRSGIGGVPELWIEEELGLLDPLLGQHLNAETISVTAICLAWAQFIGCNPILLSGVDLAYTGGLRYAPGVDVEEKPDLEETKRAADRIVKRKDRKGRPVYTAVRWLMESASFSHFAKMHPETTFLNTTEGGIGFRKIPYCPLEEAGKRFFNQEFDLRAKIQQEIGAAPMPAATGEIIASKMHELKASLTRIIDWLEILAGEKQGSSPLAEVELLEEMAYPYLFYDAHLVLDRELSLDKKGDKWKHFLNLARKYQLVLF